MREECMQQEGHIRRANGPILLTRDSRHFGWGSRRSPSGSQSSRSRSRSRSSSSSNSSSDTGEGV